MMQMTCCSNIRKLLSALGLLCTFVLCQSLFVTSAAALDGTTTQTAKLSKTIQSKSVKIYGTGGFGGLDSYQSGFFITDQGHVLTSWSTVLDVSVARVITSDGKRYEATVVGSDPTTELAVLKVDIEGNDYFAINESLTVAPGTRVFACSNLFNIAAGQEPVSVQKGVVMALTQLSAKRGRLKTIYQGPILVLDAMTNNPGATGGAVVDIRGQVVGLLGKELKDEGAGIYMNYALPNSILAGSVKRILSGEVMTAERIRSAQPASDPHTLSGIGITLVPDVLTKTPAYIDEIKENSAGKRSGILANDLVLLINNHRIDSQKSLREFLATINRNDSFTMLVQRGQELVQIEVKP